MRTISFSSLGVSAAAAAVLLVGPFFTGGPTAGEPEPTRGVPTVEIDERDLEAFAEAYVVVAAVHQRIALGSERHADRESLLAFKEAGEAEATEAIERAGLSRARFQEILSVLANDDELRDDAIARISRARSPAPHSNAAAAGPPGRHPNPDA